MFEGGYVTHDWIFKEKNVDIVVSGVCVRDSDEDKREGEILQTNIKRHMIKSKSLIFHHIST